MNMLTEQSNNPPHPEPDGNRKRPSVLVMVLVVLLLIALIGGSSLWLLHKNNGSSHGALNSATANASSTEVPTWSPTEITPPALSSFYDTFENNNHDWSLSSGEGGYFRILVNDSLVLANTNPRTPLVESVPTSTSLDNYEVSVDFMMDQGDGLDSTGLYLRGDSNLDHDYRVDINGNNTFDLAREELNAHQQPHTTMLLSPRPATNLRPFGKQNTLTVIMLNSTIAILFNNVLAAIVTDTSYTDGQMALFVRHGDSSAEGVTVSFTRVEVDRLSSPLATPDPSTPTATYKPS